MFRSLPGEDLSHVQPCDIGPMDSVCVYCSALRWRKEIDSMCCSEGRVRLPLLDAPPEPLRGLLLGTSTNAKKFRQHLRQYNSALTLCSMWVKVDDTLTRGVSQFRISGAVYHRLGSPLPAVGQPPQFAQVYICDADEQAAVRRRLPLAQSLDHSLLRQLADMLMQENPYVQIVRRAATLDAPDLQLVLRGGATNDRRRYNLPRASEVAAFVPADSNTANAREVRVNLRGGGLKIISEYNPAYDPLHYVLLFPRGEQGWELGIPLGDVVRRPQRRPLINPDTGMPLQVQARTCVTPRQFAAFYLMVRHGYANYLQRCQRLYEAYIVDQYCKIEQQRLAWCRFNQPILRSHVYCGIQDATEEGDCSASSIGRRIILPSSFGGSPRHMHGLYQDAMAIVGKKGKADLFITMTANPKWKEVQEALLPGQIAADRPDVVARVFRLRLRELMDDLLKKNVLGCTVAHMWVTEFQKRGLPHAHLLLFFADADKLHTPDDYDDVVCAEILDRTAEPELYDIIATHQMHGPCGLLDPNCPCMRDGVCKDRYPKDFNDNTLDNDDGYPMYRRRDNGRTVCTPSGIVLDNRWVVPYNRALGLRYKCHLNVECCASIYSVKYLHKYIWKGPDRAEAAVIQDTNNADEANKTASQVKPPRDEIKEFMDGRYVSTSEATCRILQFPLHAMEPHVLRLPVHLRQGQSVCFSEDTDLIELVDSGCPTELTAWFESNAKHEAGRHLLYADYIDLFVWLPQLHCWMPRQRGHGKTIGRMYFIPPSAGEKYFLRVLLTHVAGATSFEDLRMYNGITYETFQEACRQRGLLDDDQEWDNCLAEAATYQSAATLRQLWDAAF